MADLRRSYVEMRNRDRYYLQKEKFFAVAGAVVAGFTASALFAAEKLDPHLVDLADHLAASVSSADEEKLIATLPPELRGKPLRDAIADTEYRIMFSGEYAKAERLCDVLEKLGRDAGDGQDVARAEVLRSAIWRELGDYTGTLSLLDRALDYYKAHPDDQGIVGVYQGKGIASLYEGDFARALDSLNHALSLAEKFKFKEGIIPALNSIGEVYREQGLPERALEFYAKARAAVANDSAWNMAFIFNNIGQAYEAMGDRGKAVEFIEKARAVAENHKMRPRVATSLAVLAKIAADEERFEDAQRLYAQSLTLSRELRDAASEGRALVGLSEVARRTKRTEEALARAEEAIAVFRTTGQTDWLVAALTSAGRALQAQGDDAAARARFEEAISMVESMRGHVVGAEAETQAFLEQRLAPYQELIALLAGRGDATAALMIAERSSARVLLDVMSGGTSHFEDVISESEAARLRDLDRKIAELNRRANAEYAAEKRDEQRLAQATAVLEGARHERADFEAELIAAHPKLKRSAAAPAMRGLADFAPLVNDGSVALKFAVTKERCFVFVLRRGDAAPRLDLVTLNIARDELTRRAEALRRAVADRSLNWQEPARDLFDRILAPVEQLCAGATRVVIAPDGPLWEVPFRVLVDRDRHVLLERFAITVAPSLSALLEAERRVVQGGKDVVVFANPAVGENRSAVADAASSLSNPAWQPLPEMEKQARAIEKLYPPSAVRAFIGEAAREETAKRELPTASVIEFATHGALNDRSPLYSYLLLSQHDLAPGEDGLLEARELMRLPLHARLAILCGCETARGRIGAGEGVIGLAWSLLVAGCPSTVVSQWKVDEHAATPLMLALHRELLHGASRAEALRRAMLELRKNEHYRHPFYWAPFLLIGDPR